MINRLYIAIDFDGTVVAHEYPLIGRSVGAEPVLKALVEAGHKLILFTMRGGTELAEAEEWFVQKEIEIWQVNRNPEQDTWTRSPKVWANIYIDDCAVGVPLRADSPDERPFVDWVRVHRWLVDKGVLDDFGEEDDEK
jgi:hypothetical protein